MSPNQATISVRGKRKTVPTIQLEDIEIITQGGWLKTAVIKDEEYVEGNPFSNPEQLVSRFQEAGGSADIFAFSAQIPNTALDYDYPLFWDNAAVIPIISYKKWWDDLCQVARRNVRIATKRGLTVAEVSFDDALVRGITSIYNETPVRQGRKFWHFGKDTDTVRRENSTYLERSTFISAHCGDELIGFIKIVYVNNIASIMQILSKANHQDKRPTNALIAKTVEVCAARGISHLRYCNFVYHDNYNDPLTDFKRRNGFVELRFPRYFLPLSAKGHLAILANCHLGVAKMLPKFVVLALLKARSTYSSGMLRFSSVSAGVAQRQSG